MRKPAEQRGFAVIPRRWAVERTLAWITSHRRLAHALSGHAVGCATVTALAERLGVREVATLDRCHFSVVRPSHVEAFTLLP